MARRVKFLFVLLFLALSCFYLYVLYLSTKPQVSMTYKMYYLEQKTHFWNRNQTLAYIPGTEMNLIPYRDRCFYLSREGWDLPEKDKSGTLFSGDGGLYFTLHSVPGALHLVAKFTALTDNTELTVSIKDWSSTVNIAKAGPQTVTIDIPADIFVADPDTPNYVHLHSNHTMKFQSFNFIRAE